jgi:acyl-coenzyme A thioesterase PaaI-like protein
MERAFQEDMVPDYCFGCGVGNERGLGFKSYWDGDEAVGTFEPRAHLAAGPRHVLNGGIISTIIDCHGVCTAIADAYRREGRAIGSEPLIWYATASLKVDYLHPTPISQPVSLRARITKRGKRKTVVSVTAVSGGQICARSEVIAVRVRPEWMAES